MGEFKHFVIVKFKEGVVVEELTKGMEKLVSEIDAVKSFEWYVFLHLWPYYLTFKFRVEFVNQHYADPISLSKISGLSHTPLKVVRFPD